MPTIKVSVPTSLSPEQVLERLTDFGPARAEAWSTVDAEGLTVHDQRPAWAEVTRATNWAGSANGTPGTPIPGRSPP